MTRAKWIGLAAILGGVGFGVLGGEYSTFDWMELRRARGLERAAIQRLRVEVDSLASEAELIESDPATQERVAREEFGMLRPGEKIYRFHE